MSLEYDVGTNLGIGFFNPAQSKEMWFRRFNSVAISLLTTAFIYMNKYQIYSVAATCLQYGPGSSRVASLSLHGAGRH